MAKTKNLDKTYLDTSWKALQYFNIYRFLVSFLFVALIWMGQLPDPLGIYDQFIFSIASHIYLVSSFIIGFLIELQRPRYNLQVAAYLLVDIVIISLMMYASAGLNSGFGMLMVIAVAGGSILRVGKIAILFAAIATLVVLGHELYIEFSLTSFTANYTHAGFLGITFFITAILGNMLANRVQESEALAEQRAADLENLSELNEQIVQHMQSGIIVLDEQHKIRLSNESANILLGLSTTTHMEDLNKIAPELAGYLSLWESDAGKHTVIFKPAKGEVDIQASFTSLSSEARIGILIFLEDVAQIRQRAQHMKLASLGRLAASIAHEVRNPLGAISHASQLLSESDRLGKENSRLIQIIIQHSQRVNTIIENTMRISRREPSLPESIHLNEWLDKFINEFKDYYELNARAIIYSIDQENMHVRMDPGQLHQVFWNLCENAMKYAKGNPILEFKGGVIKETDRAYIDIIDHGPGIEEELVERLFEPFFTTDEQGSGLGLYIARELCEANQASLRLYANSNSGCCFRINFSHADRQHGAE